MNTEFATPASFAAAPLGALWDLFHGDLQTRGWLAQDLAYRIGLALLALASVAAAAVLYAKESARLGVARRLVLAGVRMCTLLVVVFLLLRPVWVVNEGRDKRRPVAVLIDVSESMNSADPRPANEDQGRVALAFSLIEADKGLPAVPITSLVPKDQLRDRPKRIEVAREALTNPKIGLFNQLRAIGPLEISTFGDARTGRDAVSTDWIKSLEARQPKTRLVSAAFELLNRDDGELPAAIVLVTDGRDNASDKSFADLAAKCRDRGIPLHIYGVGSSSFGQLRLRDVGVPESVFVDDLVSVPVRYAVKGLRGGGRVSIVVKFGDRVVATSPDIPVREGEDLREVLTFTPTKEDAAVKKPEVTVTVTVTTEGSAAETLTDSAVRPTQVISKKLKVLVVDGLPRVDFKFLQRALLRDRRVDARFFLTEGDREAMKSGYPWLVEFTRQLNGVLALDRDEFRKLLNDYDLLVLGDVGARFFSTDHQQVIKDFVAEGGGLIHIAGRWNVPRGWLEGEPGRASVADVLPVELKPHRWPIQPPEGRYYQPFVPVLAPSAIRNPLVALEDDPLDNLEVWGRLTRVNDRDPAFTLDAPRAGKKRQLPPLEWYYPVTRLKPGAEVFLVHPTARTPEPDNRPVPLLVGHYFGKGYVLFCGFDDTWRWRFNEGDRYFGRFWSQCVYQAGVPRLVGTRLTQLSLDTLEPLEGKSGQVYARILDENFKALTTEELDATLEKLDAEPNDKDRLVTVKLRKLDGQDGEYVAPLPFNKAGRFKLSLDPKNKSPATMEYRVTVPPDHELAPGGMAEEELRKLAADSGRKDKPGKFYHEEDLYKLPKDIEPQYAPYSSRDETVLWNRWALFLLIGLLSLEWTLRKFNGLS
ncbi:hypothetical protein [Frigoriglobus tundricola]|uniref:VWFA domain-containing protein n=1 Tax=Frigoriglobus tundricola TaxID=2774151 RepID=A0A6M5YFF4_9BACT|nr:hypothetical protein [Frigoriglobus tundricola]QJW92729.1 hypothetical protein FTUN_0226 [Frigoriglobus tundricola]